jgi:hypothetical protein
MQENKYFEYFCCPNVVDLVFGDVFLQNLEHIDFLLLRVGEGVAEFWEVKTTTTPK